MEGHFAGEVWGLAVNSEGFVVSSADDNKIIVFDPEAKRTVNVIKVN